MSLSMCLSLSSLPLHSLHYHYLIFLVYTVHFLWLVFLWSFLVASWLMVFLGLAFSFNMLIFTSAFQPYTFPSFSSSTFPFLFVSAFFLICQNQYYGFSCKLLGCTGLNILEKFKCVLYVLRSVVPWAISHCKHIIVHALKPISRVLHEGLFCTGLRVCIFG